MEIDPDARTCSSACCVLCIQRPELTRSVEQSISHRLTTFFFPFHSERHRGVLLASAAAAAAAAAARRRPPSCTHPRGIVERESPGIPPLNRRGCSLPLPDRQTSCYVTPDVTCTRPAKRTNATGHQILLLLQLRRATEILHRYVGIQYTLTACNLATSPSRSLSPSICSSRIQVVEGGPGPSLLPFLSMAGPAWIARCRRVWVTGTHSRRRLLQTLPLAQAGLDSDRESPQHKEGRHMRAMELWPAQAQAQAKQAQAQQQFIGHYPHDILPIYSSDPSIYVRTRT